MQLCFFRRSAKSSRLRLSSLGSVKFKGNFPWYHTKFVTNGTLSTNLGGLSANIVMAFPHSGLSVYNGRLVTQKFDLGRFLRIADMGTLSFDGDVKGVGLTLNTLKTSVTGKIGQFTFKEYTYQNIDVEGTFQRKQFDGTVKIDDENIDFYTTVKMDFRNAQPQFNVLGDLAHSNFQKLNLY